MKRQLFLRDRNQLVYTDDEEIHSIEVSSRFSRLKSKRLRDILHIPLQASLASLQLLIQKLGNNVAFPLLIFKLSPQALTA